MFTLSPHSFTLAAINFSFKQELIYLVAIPFVLVLVFILNAIIQRKGNLLGGAFVFAVIFSYGAYKGYSRYEKAISSEYAVIESKKNEIARALLHDFVFTDDYMMKFRKPKRWTVMDDLNDRASLQMGNAKTGQYFIVVKHDKSSFLGNIAEHSNSTMNGLIAQLKNPQTSPKARKLDMNGLKSLQRTVAGEMNGNRNYYLMISVEQEDAYYQVLAWTPEEIKDISFKLFSQIVKTGKQSSPPPEFNHDKVVKKLIAEATR